MTNVIDKSTFICNSETRGNLLNGKGNGKGGHSTFACMKRCGLPGYPLFACLPPTFTLGVCLRLLIFRQKNQQGSDLQTGR